MISAQRRADIASVHVEDQDGPLIARLSVVRRA